MRGLPFRYLTLDSYGNPDPENSVALQNVYLSLKASTSDSIKADLASHIQTLMTTQRLSRKAATGLSGTTRARISNLCNGKVQGCSVEAMLEILLHLGNEITVEVTPTWIKKKIRPVNPIGKK